MNQPRFCPGDSVCNISKASRNRGKYGTIKSYCKGRYPNICNVELTSGHTIRVFDTSLELKQAITR